MDALLRITNDPELRIYIHNAQAYWRMQLRVRANNDMRGPYVVTTFSDDKMYLPDVSWAELFWGKPAGAYDLRDINLEESYEHHKQKEAGE